MKPFHCHHSRATLGFTTGEMLQVGACLFRRKMELECGTCHRVRWWKPLPFGVSRPPDTTAHILFEASRPDTTARISFVRLTRAHAESSLELQGVT